MNQKLKLGLIGCGGIATNKHIPALLKLTDLCEITAFCDLELERAKRAAQQYGAVGTKLYTDYHEMLKDGEIDIIHVLTPNVSHCPITVAAFQAGKHVMCEKPMAHTASDAKQMLNAWKKSGKQFTIGYQNRFRADVLALHAACENNELGNIYFAKAHAIRRRAVPTWGVFPNKALQGGGPLIDIGTHALDITLWMMNNYMPVSVSGRVFYELGHLPQATEGNMFGPWDPKTFEVEDSAFGLIKMENGACIYLEASWAINMLESREASTTLCGTKAGAEIHSGMSYPKEELIYNRGHHSMLTEERNSPGGAIAYFTGGASEPGYLEAKQWLEAIRNNTQPLVNPEQAYQVTRILEAVYQSHEQGKEILL